MKKNKMMRLASAMLVLTLLTTSVISGTFAKYTTTGSVTDAARVAKFGVTIGSSGSLFSNQYATKNTVNDKSGSAIAYSVVSSDDTNVVAPGTENTTGMTFTLTGTPEVAVNVKIDVTGASDAGSATDIFLKAGTYLDYTTALSTDTFTFTGDYHPLVFTLKNGAGTILKTGTLSDIESYLEALSGNYAANTDLSKIGTGAEEGTTTDGTYTLTWAWAFEAADADTTGLTEQGDIAAANAAAAAAKTLQDQEDTLLGDLAADNTLTAKQVTKTVDQTSTTSYVVLTSGTDYSTDVSVGISITVTQID